MNKIPDISLLIAFGAKCWYVLPKHEVKKLVARSKEGVIIGYHSKQGYKIWDSDSQKPIVSRKVTFDATFCASSATKFSMENGPSTNAGGPGEKRKRKWTASLPCILSKLMVRLV